MEVLKGFGSKNLSVFKSEMALKNTIARCYYPSVGIYYEKKCYKCGVEFLSVRKDSLSCERPSCKTQVGRDLRAGRVFPDFKIKEIKNVIDFGKYGLKPVVAEEPDLSGINNSMEHQRLIAYALSNLVLMIEDRKTLFSKDSPELLALSETRFFYNDEAKKYRVPDVVVLRREDEYPVFVLEIFDKSVKKPVESVYDNLSEKYPEMSFYWYNMQKKQMWLMKKKNGNVVKEQVDKVEVKGLGEISVRTLMNPSESLPNMWKKVNSLDTDIKELKTKFDNLEKKVDNLDTDVKELKTKVNNLEKKVDNLEVRFDNLDTDVKELKTKVNNLEVRFDNLEKKVDNLDGKMDLVLELLRKK